MTSYEEKIGPSPVVVVILGLVYFSLPSELNRKALLPLQYSRPGLFNLRAPALGREVKIEFG